MGAHVRLRLRIGQGHLASPSDAQSQASVGGGDRAWWVIESVFLRSPDKGFWACPGDLPPDMPRRPETWVSLCNLMLKLRGI